jgi:hypothetical protein
MQKFTRFFASSLLIFSIVFNVLPCGPSYISPVFDQKRAPENPFENFAAGKLGIIKPTYNRSVLIAAYRYLNGGGFTPEEQKALIEVWKAEFENESYQANDTGEAVKKWVEKRKEVIGNEEKIPEIYVEREYGGYDFFPNCTENAFETAVETLSSRIVSYGSDNKDVKDWVNAQDKVFENCSSGRQIPDAATLSMPEWLQKDRAYQSAAAEFYALNYDSAKKRFAEIALDSTSPWRETADYLVARTLIRQASLSKSEEKAKVYYNEAEQKLLDFSSGKFQDSSERLLGLVKYRLHPQERVRELAQKLTVQSGNPNFRQDLIDYTWLMDKFEKESLETEQKRKEAENSKISNTDSTNEANTEPTANTATSGKKNEDDLSIYLYTDDYQQNWTFFVKVDATDDEVIAEAAKIVGKPLTDEMKKRLREARRSAYQSRFTSGRQEEYAGRYYGDEKTSLSILPDFLRYEDLNDWLLTFQIENNESYLYALSKYRQTNSDLWLMSAISKADSSSSELPRLLEAANRISRTSLAYPTISYHTARIYIEQGKSVEARKLLDEILTSTDNLPISTVNQFLDLRVKLVETMEDYLKYSLRKPFAYNLDGSNGTIDEFIADQKKWYDAKYEQKSREEYDREVEERFENERKWQNRFMFDVATIEVFNQHFPVSVMFEVEKSPTLPDYLREQFAMAIWTKSLILEDYATAQKIAPEVIKFNPELEQTVTQLLAVKTPLQKQTAVLYYILKNPILTPFVEDAFSKNDNVSGQFDTDDWWCAPYDMEYDSATDTEVPGKLPTKPKFLTEAQSKMAQSERKKIKDLGDAPNYLGKKVLAWAKRAPNDKRIPESLFIVYEANGWKKYSCGNDNELREQIADVLRTRYPDSEWTQKLDKPEEQ